MVLNREIPKISMEAARVNARLTQSQAAAKLGITPETLRRYEKGKSSPSMQTVEKLCSIYQYPQDYIFFP